jgi:SNF2 family DNA or RNA helicase
MTTTTLPALWPHQVEALKFVADKPAAMLALVMRSGKSRVTVELLEQRKAKQVLILCPASVVDVWPGQFAQFAQGPHLVSTLRGGTVDQRTARATALIERPFHGMKVAVINYEACWRKPFADWAMKQHWDVLICDESHRLKSPGGVASRYVSRLAAKVPFRLALTGTPMPHNPLDIYAQYRILDKSIFGTQFAYLQGRYMVRALSNAGFPMDIGCRVDPKDTKYFSQALYDEFQEKFYRIAYRVGPEVLNLPEPLHIDRYCTLSPSGLKVYKELEKDFYAEVEQGTVSASNALVKSLRLHQVTSGYAKLGETGEEVEVDDSKRKLLGDILEDLDEPVVVFCRFRHDLDNVHKVAQTLTRASLELSGRKNELLDWQAGQAPILAVQIQAGGVGIDLSRAGVAIYYSLGLSLGDHEQSLSRLIKRDMGSAAVYYYLVADGTIDVKIARALQERKDVIEAILKR